MKIARKEALAAKDVYYMTGRPCKHGHLSKRLTSNSTCHDCNKIRVNQTYHNDKSYQQSVRARTKARYAMVGNVWHEENKARSSQLNKAWIVNNKERNKLKAKEWREANRPRRCFLQNMRRAQQLKATPSWANHEAIEKVYEAAHQRTTQTGIQYSVDHIVPLNSEFVCGLHVENNLQVLTLVDNSSKNCLTWPNMEWSYV